MAKLPSTVEHAEPERPSQDLGRPALLAAFPRSAGLPMPTGQPLGREWLEEAGVADAEVSGRHVELSRKGERWSIRDVGSRNGTWVDGRPVAKSSVPLEPGSVVRMGATLLVFEPEVEGSYAASPPMSGLVGPYGLRGVARALSALREPPPPTVLIRGETGTGKELLARATADALRRGKSYVSVNITSVAGGVFESQLFGHVAGAFSGAREASPGLIRSHDGGAIFLDEIGDLSADRQVKLLRLLENREVLPVGGRAPMKVDVLVIAATHAPLESMVEAGSFRRDLLARLVPFTLRLPPLRSRRSDVFALARHLAPTLGMDLSPERCEVEAVERLLLDPWPENARGLVTALSEIRAIDAAPGLRAWSTARALGEAPKGPAGEVDLATVERAIRECGGNQSQAARVLGISRGKLRRLLEDR